MNSNAMLEEGESLANEENMAEAIEVFSRRRGKLSRVALSHYNLGVAHFMKLKEDLEEQAVWENFTDEEGHYEEAVASFERALEVDPEHCRQ
jgi:tetratricopeptide (TPR) repeat protein